MAERERTYMSIEYDTSDYDDLIREVSTEPHTDTIVALDAVLSEAFARTQAAVHVRTGKLKASGRISSSTGEGSTWTGEITYGGPDTDVEYAWYEERRGGVHDYMLAAEGMDGEFEDAVVDTLANGH